MDPLSRLYRAPPPHDSPGRDDSIPLEINPMHVDTSLNPSLGKVAFSAFQLIKCLEEMNEVWLRMRNSTKQDDTADGLDQQGTSPTTVTKGPVGNQWDEYWGATNPPPNTHVHLHKSVLEEWVKTGSYQLHYVLLSCTTQNLDQLPGMK